MKNSYEELKNDFYELKADFDDVKKKLEAKADETKSIKKLNSEISKLKEDYKNCMDAVHHETFERNKAETIANVLRETLKAQNEMSENLMDVDVEREKNNKVFKDTSEAEQKLDESQSPDPNLAGKEEEEDEEEMFVDGEQFLEK